MSRTFQGKVGQVGALTRRLGIAATALMLVVAACGGNGQDDAVADTAPPASSSSAAPVATTGGAAALPPTTTVPVSTTTSTVTTSTAAPTTTVTTTTTAEPEPPSDAMAIAEAKTAAVAAVVPAGWTADIVPGDDDDDSDDIVFAPCLGPDAFDIDNIEPFTAAALQTEMTGPDTGFFGAAQASIEARIFESEAVAAEAFETLVSVIGTDEGRECLTGTVMTLFSSDFPPDVTFEFAIEGLSVGGADAGARIIMLLATQGIEVEFFIDLLVARSGACTVFASYVSAEEPFPADLQDLFFQAALSG